MKFIKDFVSSLTLSELGLGLILGVVLAFPLRLGAFHELQNSVFNTSPQYVEACWEEAGKLQLDLIPKETVVFAFNPTKYELFQKEPKFLIGYYEFRSQRETLVEKIKQAGWLASNNGVYYKDRDGVHYYLTVVYKELPHKSDTEEVYIRIGSRP